MSIGVGKITGLTTNASTLPRFHGPVTSQRLNHGQCPTGALHRSQQARNAKAISPGFLKFLRSLCSPFTVASRVPRLRTLLFFFLHAPTA